MKAPRAVELTWMRCLDGYKIQEPTTEEIQHFEERRTEDETTLGGVIRLGTRAIPASERHQPYFAVETLAKEGISIVDEFINTPGDDDSICKFYSRFGPLSMPQRTLDWPRRGDPAFTAWYGPNWLKGEQIDDWLRAQQSVTDTKDYITAGGLTKAAQIYSRNDLGRSYVRVTRLSSDGPYQAILEPASLLSLIWIELGIAITGGAEFRECKVCKRPMLIGGHTGGKATKETCSARCRFAAYKAGQKTRQGRAPA